MGRQINWEAKNLCFALQHGCYGVTQPCHQSSRVQLASSMAALVINHSTQYSIPTQQQLRENRNILKGRHSRDRKVNCRNWWKSSLQTGKYLYLLPGKEVPPLGWLLCLLRTWASPCIRQTLEMQSSLGMAGIHPSCQPTVFVEVHSQRNTP